MWCAEPEGVALDAHADLVALGLGDMVRLAARLRDLAPECTSIAEFATRVCSHLHEHLVDPDGTRQTVLVRFYGTVPYAALPAEEQDFAKLTWGRPDDGTICLTLLGTVGTEPEWNDRLLSRGHRVIPLTDPEHVAGLPMVAALLHQLGIDVEMLFSASAHLLLEGSAEPYGVFHVPEAKGSPVIPGQDFVTAHDVESVLGFGGALPTGEVYAVVMFARVLVARETAELFQNIALSTSLAALDMLATPIFPASPSERVPARPLSERDRGRAREELLSTLLQVHERVAVSESDAARRALERANHETERYSQLARTLQASLIPPELPTFAGAETGAFYRPAGDGSEVGGDFYDLFPIRDAVWGMVLGDVSGKGAGAATLTALARHTVRAAAFHAESGVNVLAALDNALHRHVMDERYLTALFAEVTPLDGVLQVDLTLGGHPRPFLLRADGSVEAVGQAGSVLGLLTDPVFHEERCVLRPGDSLVAFTDGVTDARRGSEDYGEERLRSLLEDCIGLPADAIAAGVGDAVLRFQGEHAHDDTALVVLRCV